MGCEEPTTGGNRGVSSTDSSKREIYQLDEFEKMKADLTILKRNLENQPPAAPNQVATPIAHVSTIVCPACDTEGHTIEEYDQLPMMKDTFWVNYQKGQNRKGSYENGNQPKFSYNNQNQCRDNQYNSLAPPHPSGDRYVAPNLRNTQHDIFTNTNDQNQRRVFNDPPKTIEELLEQQSLNMDKNFDRLKDGIKNLVKLMGGGRLPAQPVHAINGNIQGQNLMSKSMSSLYYVVAKSCKRQKRSEEGNELNSSGNYDFQNNFYTGDQSPIQATSRPSHSGDQSLVQTGPRQSVGKW